MHCTSWIFLYTSVLIIVSFFTLLLNSICEQWSYPYRLLQLFFIPLLTDSVSYQIEHPVIMQLTRNLSLKYFSGFLFYSVACLSDLFLFIIAFCFLLPICFLYFVCVLVLSQVYINRHFSSSTYLQAWNFFSKHLRKWKYLEHSWSEYLVSCKS